MGLMVQKYCSVLVIRERTINLSQLKLEKKNNNKRMNFLINPLTGEHIYQNYLLRVQENLQWILHVVHYRA